MVEAVATIGLERMPPVSFTWRTLRKRAAAGKLSAYKPGKTWVFLQDELLN
jgi:hypothetical protein